jgi:hypothetical protein
MPFTILQVHFVDLTAFVVVCVPRTVTYSYYGYLDVDGVSEVCGTIKQEASESSDDDGRRDSLHYFFMFDKKE